MKNNQSSPFTSYSYLLVKKMVTTLLMWQMIFSPSVFAGNISGDATLQAQKDACTGASKEWNSTLNSCKTKVAAEQTKTQSEACSQSNNPDECYLTTAVRDTGVSSEQDYKDSDVETVAMTVSGAYLVFGLLAGGATANGASGNKIANTVNKKKDVETCMSGSIFQWTSLAWVAGDLLLKYMGKKGFEKIAEDYKKEEANDQLKGTKEGSYQAQVRAFEYLKREQEDVKKQANKRKLLQMAVVVGYVASLGYAIAELYPTSTLPKCVSPDAEDTATDTGETPTTKAAGPGSSFMSLFDKVKGLVGTSLGNAISSGIMLGLNGYLIYHATDEKNKARRNIKSIDKVLTTYNDYMSGFCPDGRQDAANPNCYCYNTDGTKNPNRTKSVICQNLFAERGVNYADQKAKEAASGPRQGCVTVTGQFDLNCKCTKMKNTQTGQNACAKVSSISTNNTGLASALALPDAIKTANGLTNGASTALAKMNGASVASKAARSMKKVNGILSNGIKNGVNVPTKGQLNNMIAKNLRAQVSKMKNPPSLAQTTGIGQGVSALPPSVKKALAKAQKDNKSSAAVGALLSSLSNGNGKIGRGKTKANTFVWNDSASGSGGKVQTFMDKKYKYKNADIVNRKDVSLWNVISRRYQTSGLKRLFDDEQ